MIGLALAILSLPIALPALLILLFILRHLVRKSLESFYLLNFTTLRNVPYVPITSPLQLLTGHPTWGAMAYINRIDSATVARNINNYRDKYGPIFVLRNILGTPFLQIADPAALRHVTIRAPYKYPKSQPARRAMGMLLGYDGILFAEGDKHKRIKRIVAPALHFNATAIYGGALLQESSSLAERFLKQANQDVRNTRNKERTPLLLKEEVGAATFYAILRAFVGKKRVVEHKQEALKVAYLACIEQMTEQLPGDILRMAIFDFLPAQWISSNRRRKLLIRQEVTAILTAAMRAEDESHGRRDESDKNEGATSPSGDIEQRSKKDPAVLLTLMTKAQTEDGRLSISEMTDTMLSFLAAGQATSAMSVCWTLYLIARYPNWQTRLQQEIDAAGWTAATNEGVDIDETVKKLVELPILDRIVKESLRLYPPASYSIRITGEDDTLCGYRIPAGTMCNIPMLALQMSERYWDRPEDFDPDRFLPERDVKRDKMVWCPFLQGTRGCIGRNFAIVEIKSFVAEVVRRLDISVNPEDPMPLMQGGLSGYPPGLRLYGRPRASGTAKE